jgi:hypothetical protein
VEGKTKGDTSYPIIPERDAPKTPLFEENVIFYNYLDSDPVSHCIRRTVLGRAIYGSGAIEPMQPTCLQLVKQETSERERVQVIVDKSSQRATNRVMSMGIWLRIRTGASHVMSANEQLSVAAFSFCAGHAMEALDRVLLAMGRQSVNQSSRLT